MIGTHRLVGLVLMLAWLPLLPQTPTPGRVKVLVREAETGRPLGDVPISFRFDDPALPPDFKPPPGFEPLTFVRRTAADGSVTVSSLFPGPYRLHVDSRDHLSFEPRDSVFPVTSRASAEGAVVDEPGAGSIPIRAGADETVTFDLRRAAVIRGRVLTIDGAPAVGVAVHLLRPWPGSQYRRFSATTTTSSDANGGFRFSPLLPGTYYLRTVSGSGDGQRFNDVYYPGMQEPSKAAAIDARAGKDVEVSLLAPFAPRVTIAGQLAPPLATSDVGLTIRRLTDASSDAIELFVVPVGEGGRFVIVGQRSGTYLLQARRSGATDHVVAQALVQTGGSDLLDVGVAPPAPSQFRARLELPAGASLDWSDLEVGLIAADGVPRNCQFRPRSDASYPLLMMPAGRCRAFVTPPDGWLPLGVVMRDGTNLLLEPVHFEPGRDYGELTIKVTNQFARLTGKIPAPLMPIRDMLLVAPEDRRYRDQNIETVESLEVKEDGTFEALVAPGHTYLVGLCIGRCISMASGLPSADSTLFQRVATRVVVDQPAEFIVTVRDPRQALN